MIFRDRRAVSMDAAEVVEADARPPVEDWGIRTRYVPHSDGSLTVCDTQDVEPILEFNKARQNDGHDYYTRDRSMVAVADMPLVVYQDLMKAGIVGMNGRRTDQKALRRFLNDPDNRVFRINAMRL
jgi:hypothetical protein